MAKRDKRLERAKRLPKDWSFEEHCQLYEDHGFEVIPPRRGSHYTARFAGISVKRTFPRRNPIKLPHIEEALAAIDEVQEYL